MEKDTWNTKETPAGAQAKADVALAAAIAYTDQEVNDLAGAGRTTETVKGNADALAAHLAETMPHRYQDIGTGATYQYGLKQQNNHLVFMYQEVV